MPKDDRGQRVPLPEQEGFSRAKVVAVLCLCLVVTLVLVRASVPALNLTLYNWGVVGLSVVLVVYALDYRRRHERREKRSRLAKGACAACWYDLARLDAQPDGCTVCPECGAAWRLPEEGTEARRHEDTEE